MVKEVTAELAEGLVHGFYEMQRGGGLPLRNGLSYPTRM